MPTFDSRRKALEQRQKLLQSLITGASQPLGAGQMVGDHFVPTSPLAAFGQAAQGIIGAYGFKKAEEESAALERDRTAALVQELQRVQGLPQNEQPAALAASEFAETREMGNKALLKALEPKELKMFEGTLYDPYTGKQGPKIEGRKNYKVHRGQMYDPQTGELVGGQVGQAAPGNTTTINMPAMETAFDKELGKIGAQGTVEQLVTQRQQVVNNINQVQKLREISGQEMLSGRLAPVGVFISQLGASFGIPVSDKLANSARYDAAFQQPVTQMILAGGRGITNEEGERIAKTWAPLWESPEGRTQILNDLEQLNMRQYQQIEQAAQTLQTQNPRAYETLQRLPGFTAQPAPPPQAPQAAPGPQAGPGNPQPIPGPAQQQAPVQIQSDQEFDALPSGATFLAPDGSLRRKP